MQFNLKYLPHSTKTCDIGRRKYCELLLRFPPNHLDLVSITQQGKGILDTCLPAIDVGIHFPLRGKQK